MSENPYEVNEGGMTPPPIQPPPMPGGGHEKEPWDASWTLLWGFTVTMSWVVTQTLILVTMVLIGEGIPSDVDGFEDDLLS